MTLEERAEEYIKKNCQMWEEGELTVDEIVRLTYKDCAKETENELADKLLDNWCRNKDDYCPHLKALEKQIEKMKCCENCKNYEDEICKVGHYFDCKNCTECGEKDYKDYWELAK